MKIINIHQREYNHPLSDLSKIFETLATDNDLIWPKEKWNPMILDNGLCVNSSGGHGIIRYYISRYEDRKLIEFRFVEPKEFVGIHCFELIPIADDRTIIKHTINAQLNVKGLILWYLVVKWLHDALLEDCLDKIENNLEQSNAKTNYNPWVKILRKIFKKD